MKSVRTFLIAATIITTIQFSAPAEAARRSTYSPPRKGFFSRLVELERRKNAWIRENILRR